MRRIIIFFLTLLAANSLYAQVTFSGVLDTTVVMNAGAENSPAFTFGFEEYANMRFQARLREGATINGAVNLTAASGINAAPLAGYSIPITENFIAAIDLERLQLRLRGEYIDFDGGLFRLPFGYSQVWGPSDFLNPKNPLKPDARPRGVLGTSLTWYPVDEMKLLLFFAAPRNVFEIEGKGSRFGISMDRHWEKASVQALYAFEIPHDNFSYGIHRAGLSVKADIEAGFVLDAFYIYDPNAFAGIDGLSLSFGADYSFFEGNLIILAEYLFNGKKSSTASGYGGNFSNYHYLSASLTFRFSDFTSMSASLITCFDDISFTPVVSVTHEMFQGVALTISAMAPLDRDLFFNDGNKGELGPKYNYFTCTARIRVRF
ncbi:MAG: hypothetical protein FWC17_01170 [Treponema sp.]|nr:hypothetical protein [Treponema sp.]MCL2266359.1 hypothetical protein [Treponema sp.]